MSAPELLPCPFCGGEAHIYETTQDSDTQVQAQCKGCGAEIAFWLPWTSGGGQKVSAYMDVERRWNRRTDLAAAAEARAKVEGWNAAVEVVAARFDEAEAEDIRALRKDTP